MLHITSISPPSIKGRDSQRKRKISLFAIRIFHMGLQNILTMTYIWIVTEIVLKLAKFAQSFFYTSLFHSIDKRKICILWSDDFEAS